MSSSNLPPGVTESMIPGNRPEDVAEEAFWEALFERLDAEGIRTVSTATPVSHVKVVIRLEDLAEDENFAKIIQTARDMGYAAGVNEARLEADIERTLEEER